MKPTLIQFLDSYVEDFQQLPEWQKKALVDAVQKWEKQKDGERMEFVIEGKLINQAQPPESKECKHKIRRQEIDGTIYRHCKECGMVAHEDGRFDYCCGSEYCRCMS